ncbi:MULTISPECIES: flagellar biosynthetic protein FliR [Geobacter]|uniref:Flagellar biosynthetic protein FliR n=2 Tax=Geobacter TaxID=28231 RepID=A0A0C1R0R3_9BACT|nr:MULTISPECIES: flagellar biosynthetic protein FliR [Geobacter]ANA39349.1 flagellar biosynthetic protein FliR [Geobacter anodireducens]KIE44091.1 flagellar biosynthesis protein FliR [Geobacter soli]MBE2886443.1 flagellar biosynthetic protein FliR [Geobacter anodireducens]HMN02468.1 flagellar biosynthetic protein FliR [Geobacter anodireducens]
MFPLTTPFPTVNDVAFFTLVMGRMAGIFAAIPIFGGRRVPTPIKALLVFAMTMVCFPIIKGKMPQFPTDMLSLGFLMVQEVLVGVSLGLLSLIIFAAVEFAGQIASVQIGLTIVTEFDPSQGGQLSIMSIILEMLATLLFLSLGMHHIFIGALVQSYDVLPLGAWHMSGGLLQFIVTTIGEVFVLAVRLAAPVMVTLLATSVMLGIMARSFPQMNVFFVSMPLNIGIGFIILGLSLPLFLHTVQGHFGMLDEQLKTMMKLMGKG